MADGRDRPEPIQDDRWWGSVGRADGGSPDPRLLPHPPTTVPGVDIDAPEGPVVPNTAPVEVSGPEAGRDKEAEGRAEEEARDDGVDPEVPEAGVTPPAPPRSLRRLRIPSRAGSRVARGLDTPDPSPIRAGELMPLAPRLATSLVSHWAARCCSWEHHWDTSGGLEAGPTPGAAATLALDTKLDTRARRGGSGGPTTAGAPPAPAPD